MTKLHNRRFNELSIQLDALVDSKKPETDWLDERILEVSSDAVIEWGVKARNLLVKACGENSEHYRSFVENEAVQSFDTNYGRLKRIRAVFLAAKEDFAGGYLTSVRSLVQAEVFDSELEQSRELFKSNFNVAAAVICGTVLETTLRELCERNDLPRGKLSKMNEDLAKAGIYNRLIQKRIIALADIRNSAAHGKPEEFTSADVGSMIDEVERFVADNLTV